MALLDLVLGRRLSSAEDKAERVGSFAGVSVFSAIARQFLPIRTAPVPTPWPRKTWVATPGCWAPLLS